MKSTRRPNPRRAKPSAKAKAPPFPGAWSVVAVDSAPIRAKARGDYDSVLQEIDRTKAERERFQTADQPAYRQWLNANFGPTLTELRELGHRLQQVADLVDDVETEFFLGNYRSIATAYAQVKRRREQVAEPQEPEDDAARAEADRQQREFEEDIRKLYEQIHGRPFEDDGNQDESAQQGSPRSRAARLQAETPQTLRLKDFYRQLVRRLHPDHAGELSEKHRNWWHQTQDAYREGNIEKLELILTLLDIEAGGTRETSVAMLLRLTRDFKRALAALRREVVSFRKDPAWKFSVLADRDEAFQQTLWSLDRERARMRERLAAYEQQIASWEQSLQQTRPRKRVQNRAAKSRQEAWF